MTRIMILLEGMVKILKDLLIKLSSFWSRIIRLFVFSVIVSLALSFTILVVNLFLGVKATFVFYRFVLFGSTLFLTFSFTVYKGRKMFAPVNKPLIKRLERERLERARQNNRERNKRNNRAAS